MKILLVEDHPEERELLRRVVTMHGHAAREAANGVEALAQVEREPPDLIISDLLMPGLDGFRLLQAIRRRPGLAHIPFVVYSAVYTSPQEKAWAASLGATLVLEKPLPPDRLWAEIEVFLAQAGTTAGPAMPAAGGDELDFLKEHSTIVSARLARNTKDLQAAQAAMAVCEGRYRRLFLSLRDVIFIADQNWRIVDVNQPALRQTLGYEREEVVGAEVCHFFQGVFDIHGVREQFCRTTAGGEPPVQRFRVPVHRRDGTMIVGHVGISGLYDPDSRPVGVIVDIRDITREEAAEDRLLQMSQEWDQTFDAIGDVVCLLNPSLEITRINAAGCSLFHARAEDLIGKRCHELFTGRDQACPMCPVAETVRDCRPHSQEIRHHTLGKIFQVTVTPLVDNDGRLTGVAHFARDITEQRELEKQLRQAQKLESIGTLAGGIAHDFNNILTAIYGYGELLDMKLAEGSTERQDLKQILTAASRARDLVRQILTFSRSGEHDFEPLSVQVVLKEAVKLLRASLPSTISIRQEIDSDCRQVLADATQIHQVLMNLCTNAFQAMRDSGGELTVVLRERTVREGEALPGWGAPQPGAYLELVVRDTGCGIPAYLQEKIFEPYFSTKERGEGTGLGLSVVHGIVAAHGGHIGVESEEGRGAAFHLYLPLIVDDQAEVVGGRNMELQVGGGERILLVDDEATLVRFEERALAAYGYSVTSFTSSVQAWEAFAANPQGIDLLLTDMTMPGLTGTQLVEKVRALRPDLPIIVCTGFSAQVGGPLAADLRVQSVLMKPLTMRALVQAVRAALAGE